MREKDIETEVLEVHDGGDSELNEDYEHNKKIDDIINSSSKKKGPKAKSILSV